ncbi:CLUMA_CG010145, isoform A [Clunio marinus]|uniref:CLUMA_CG010145, isoform A n=1 Tax=Clunio marinus TaxID=568069 RepID=A0A1J1I8Y6_9DIPT|nr:CLUMA_CG010145, isoform A [Clunio marinus]
MENFKLFKENSWYTKHHYSTIGIIEDVFAYLPQRNKKRRKTQSRYDVCCFIILKISSGLRVNVTLF